MARTLSHLFFATLKRAAKMQRQALKQVDSALVKKRRKPAPKKPAGLAPARASRAAPAAGAPPPGKGKWQDLIHLTAPAGLAVPARLAYSLYRPAGHPTAGLPLLILLHGCQQNAHDIATGSRMNQLADQKGFVVAYPQQAKRAQAMQCWRWFHPTAGAGLAEADAIASLAVALARQHRLDPSRIHIAGLSAGASMAALVALRHPEVFAAVAMHSGAVLGAAHNAVTGLRTMRRGSSRDPVELIQPLVAGSQPFPGMPALILHGRRDHTVVERNALQLARQFSALNHADQARETVMAQATHREYTRVDFLHQQRVAVRLCLLNEVDHAWSGGNDRLKFNSAKGPRASLLIWQFFAQQRRLP